MEPPRLLIGVDDTDNKDDPMGTGKLVRLLWGELETLFPGTASEGVLRLQLLVDPRIPYTSHNSPACLILRTPEGTSEFEGIAGAVHAFVRQLSAPGSDPGVCIARMPDVSREVVEFGLEAASRVVERERTEALARAAGLHLTALGGDGGGVIGALAAVGLAVQGSAGRYIDFATLRDLGEEVTAGDLRSLGVEVVSTDREGKSPGAREKIHTGGWLRPRRICGSPVLLVKESATGWTCYDKKQRS
ncbi:MAG: hypothetical protein AB1640_06180 [bacterium]